MMADNTRAYQAVFPAAPANRITTLDEAQRAALKPTTNEHLLKEIKGHAVLYPVYYVSAVLPTMIALATGTTCWLESNFTRTE
ncbi:hypothetical protein DIPPA_16448 [Diplonema papillatum]|nr:hypothetical protein DIPPA_16448 [Diplonema papillatum]